MAAPKANGGVSPMVSPKGKPAAKSSPLSMAGASMLGGSAPKAGTPAATPGASPGASPRKGTDDSKLSASGMSKAGASVLGRDAAKNNGASSTPAIMAGKDLDPDPKSPGAPIEKASAPAPPAAKASGAAGGSSPAKASAAPPPAAASSTETVSPEAVAKFHSAIRWAKPWSEVQEAAQGVDLKTIGGSQDAKNGNTAVHIAAQNGHLDLVLRLLDAGAPISPQNFKGQTPLHMTVEYDFYFVSRLLVDRGADQELENEDGNKAITGIDGGKTGKESWDNPVTILRAAVTPEDLELGFQALEKAVATPDLVSKEQLIQVGMAKKKAPTTQGFWEHKRFMALAAKF